jgi:hypothetical protein
VIQGTTPTHKFNIPFDTTICANMRILYSQNGKLKIVKTKNDCKLSGKSIITTLTQEDTLKFEKNIRVDVQLRILTTGGDSLVSKPIKLYVTECLEKEVIT